MSYSRSDLATRALRKAGLVAAEETPSAADLDFAEEGIASDTAALAVEGIVIWNGDDQVVPIEQLEPRARYHAITFKEDFGVMSSLEASQTRKLEKMALWKLAVVPATGEESDATYY